MLESLLRWFSPFRLMKDVSRGTREERIAAYRYNRRRRSELTACMRRWAVMLAGVTLLTVWFDALANAGGHAEGQGVAIIFVYLAALCATFLACGLCVLFITAYVYVYLTSHDG